VVHELLNVECVMGGRHSNFVRGGAVRKFTVTASRSANWHRTVVIDVAGRAWRRIAGSSGRYAW
jgi:hypothetical protein